MATGRMFRAKINDPAVIYCDPQGIPRQDFYELRATQILQHTLSMVMLYQFSKIWRVVWTDGYELPQRSRPQVVRLLRGQMGGRLHVRCRTPSARGRTYVARQRRGVPIARIWHVEEQLPPRQPKPFRDHCDDRRPERCTRNRGWELNKFPMKLLPPTTDVTRNDAMFPYRSTCNITSPWDLAIPPRVRTARNK